ncbi:rhodanese-like domain-containing protein [Williamsia deligens]|uniref:Rhodanese-like domain-containing protein n=1 Tax=Williamsia deligens TaxID=321325 RepID=A0ABW3G857_9NOCA|nr:rhodanese-like domain-containing protein [Williamsia deligens]MCP2194321.1 hypothetical protein [Williamsia deligens]
MPVVASLSRSVPLFPAHPVTSVRRAPLGLPVADLPAAVAAGHRLVDVRSQLDRDLDGVVGGAIAVSPDVVVERLTPGGAASLRSAQEWSRWVLVATDGDDAEWLTWHLHAAGVTGARFLLGGVRALRAARTASLPVTESQRRDLAAIAAH